MIQNETEGGAASPSRRLPRPTRRCSPPRQSCTNTRARAQAMDALWSGRARGDKGMARREEKARGWAAGAPGGFARVSLLEY